MKKILALVVAVAMIFSTMGFPVFAEEADLTISTAEQLQDFAVSVNKGNSYEGKTVVLANNIDMDREAVVIGTQASPFKGTFDGKGYTVSNLYIYECGADSDYFADSDDCLGLFGVINTPAVIKNVTVHNPYIVGSSYVGGIVGMGYTGAIENCHVTGEIDIEGSYMVGGINGHGYAKISNCSVVGDEDWDYSYVGAAYKESDLEGDNVGGIVGHNGENNDIIGCEVKNITVSGTRKVGGIVGIAALGSDITDCAVSNVTVETTATEEYANQKASTMSIGGLVGQYQNSGSGGTISGCEVSGLTFANENNVTVSAGSIAGGFRGTNGIEEPAITASDNTVSSVSGATNDYLIPAPVANEGYTLYIYNADGTVGMTVDGTKSVSDFCLRSAIEDARVFVNNAFLFGIATPATYVVEMHEDSHEDQSFEIGSDVTVNGNGHNIVLAEGVVLTNNGTFNNVTVVESTPAPTGVAKIGDVTYATFEEAVAASVDGDEIVLLDNVAITANAAYTNNFTNKAVNIDGNGFTMTQADDCVIEYALLYYQDTSSPVSIKNLTIDGIKGGAAIWAIEADIILDNCVIKNANHTRGQGIIRTTGCDSTIKNTKFIDNNCNMLISFNYDLSSSEPSVDAMKVQDCEFVGNTCKDTAAIYFVKGASSEITGSTFTDNTIDTSSHGAIAYYSEGENGVVEGNVFKNNTIKAAGARAGVLILEAGTTASENAFISNTISSTNSGTSYVGTVVNKADADSEGVTVSGNYWNGTESDVANVKGAPTVVDNYYTTYENGVFGGLVSSSSKKHKFVITVQFELGPTMTYADDNEDATISECLADLYENYGLFGEIVELEIDINEDITLTEPLVIDKGRKVIIDLNGNDMTYNSTTQGEAMITNNGELTINDSVGTGVINYNYTGEADSTYGKGNYTISNGGTLTVNGGKITIANLSGHAKYPIDNNSTTGDAILVINGGHLYNYNTSAIRQFCNSETNKNSVTINGGVVEGYCAIWVQNPGSKTVNGSLAIAGGEIKSTAKAYVNGTAELKDVSSAIYCTIADANGAWSEASAISITGGTINENVYLADQAPATITVDKSICNGYVELAASAVAKIGDVEYETLKEAIAALKDGNTLEIFAGTLEEGSIKLPASLKNVTIKGADNHATVLKNMVIMSADGNTVSYDALTFDGIVFDNSRLTFTGMRNNVLYKDFVVNNCVFKNIVASGNYAAVHFNTNASEAVKNFTFTNNVIDGVTGSSNSGINLKYTTGNVLIENNIINNVAFRPYLIQIATDDGIADNFVSRANTFSGSSAGRLQVLTNNASGTDSVNLVVNNNIFKDVEDTQYICYYNFNPETTTADFSKNYYDIDITANPAKIYYNAAAQDVDDLVEMGVYPYYARLNEDGTIDESSLVEAPAKKLAKLGDVEYETVAAALKAAQEAGMGDVTITLIGETTKESAIALDDAFNLYGKNAFNKLTFKQEDSSVPYYIAGVYTGSRTDGGECVFDGVNIVVTDQYILEGKVRLTNNSVIKSIAEANCFFYNNETTVEPGSKIDGVIEDLRGGKLVLDGGRTDGGFNETPDMRDAIMTIRWSGDSVTVKNGAFLKINSANDVGRLTVESTTSLNVIAAKVEAYQWIANKGTINTDVDSSIATKKITGAGSIVIDATNFDGTDVAVISADMSEFTGKIEVINNNSADYKIENGKVYVVAKKVATVTDAEGNVTSYSDIQNAFKAATDGCTIEILSDVVIDYKWDCRDYVANGSHSQFKESVTINGNNHTIKFTDTVSDSNWNTIFRFEENAIVKNLTIDISEATGAQRVISAKKSLDVDNLTIVGSAKYGIVFGEGASAADLENTEISIKNSNLNGTRRAISDNEGGKDVKSVVITNNTLNANVCVSAFESITFNDNIATGDVDLRAYTKGNALNVTAKENTLNTEKKNYIDANGTVDAQEEFVIAAKGSNSPAYTKEVDGYVRVWGEGGGNAKESFVLKLYSGETLMATTQLNNVGGIIDGDVYVTWNFFYPESNDEYWTTTWEQGHPNPDAAPTKVELYIDGTLVATTEAQMNGADGIGHVEWAELGGVARAVAKIGETGYETLQEAINAANEGDTIVIVADIADEDAIVNKALTITADENNKPVLNNVSISAEGEAAVASLTVSNLKFTGDSWINSGVANKLTVSNVEADVTPSNASKTNSRSAFISLGSSEHKELALTVENCNIVSRGGSDPILGWAAITTADITGNTFGSADAYQTYSDSVKFMSIANEAVINVTGNTVYSNYNGIVFGQNTTRNNAYTANISGNAFYGGADHIWIEVSGSNTVNATINAASNNTVNGNAFTASDIKVHPNINTWTSYAGIDVITDAEGKVIGGVLSDFAEDKIAQGYAAIKNLDGNYVVGKAPTATVNNEGMQTIAAGNYMVYGGGSTAEDMPLSFVMQFVADQSEEDMATSPYAEWYGDFVITFTGIEDDSFIADGCYLAGHYGSFGWVKVPVDGMKIEEGERYPVMLGVGMGQKYDYICSSVQDFKCALYLTPEILAANPNLKVNLELAVVDNSKGSDAAASALVNNENTYKVVDYTYNADDFVVASAVAAVNGVEYTSLQDAIDAASEGDTITLLADINLADGVTVANDKKITIDLAGYTITATPTESKAYSAIINKGDLTINDSVGEGKILCNHTLAGSTAYAVNTITNGGTLTINKGVVENISTATNQIGYAIDNNSTTANAVVVINGGEVKASGSYYYDGIRQFCNNLTLENSVTVTGGSVSSIWLQNPSDGSSDRNTKEVKGAVNIAGGSVDAIYLEPSTSFEASITDGTIGKLAYNETAEGRDLAGFVTGGTFSEKPADAFAKEGYEFAANEDGTFGVVESESKLFKIALKNMNLGNSLSIRFFVNATDSTEGQYAKVVKSCANGEDVVVTIPYASWADNGAYKTFEFNGIAAKEMSDEINVTIYNAEDEAVSEVYTTSVRDYAMGLLAANFDKKYKIAAVDMLNYGAAAQKQLNYNTADLANSLLTDEQKALATGDVEYSEIERDKLNYYTTVLTADSYISLKLFFEGLTDDMNAVVTYTDHYGTPKTINVSSDKFVPNGSYKYIEVEGLAVADYKTEVACVVYNNDQTVYAKTQESISYYLKRGKDAGLIQEASDMLMRFGVSAFNALHNN